VRSWPGRWMTPPSGSRDLVWERHPPTGHDRCPPLQRSRCIHRLSKSRDRRSQNADRPTRRLARRWGDLVIPVEGGPGPFSYGPESMPPACTQLSCPYRDADRWPSRSKRMDRPAPLALVPTSSGFAWNRSPRTRHPHLAPGRTPPSAVRPRSVNRVRESTLAVIEPPFSICVLGSLRTINKKVASPWSLAASIGSTAPVERSGIAPDIEPRTYGTRLPV